MTAESRLPMRAALLAYVQFPLGGALLSAIGFAVSLFQSGPRAEYTRAVSLAPVLVMSVAGLVRAAYVYFVVRRALRRRRDVQ